MTSSFDLLIIDAGPAGLASAKRAKEYGVSVAIAEQSDLGGCCVNRGCVPERSMVQAADYAAAVREAAEYGWEVRSGDSHWQQFQTKRNRERSWL